MEIRGKRPNALVAILPIMIVMALLIWLVIIKGGAPHIAIVLGIAITSIIGRFYGYSWIEMRAQMVKAGAVTLPVIGILMTIGMLVGSWIISGTVPMLMVYGFDSLNPAIFLPAVTIVASIISLATGTSWGTLGTIGIAFMGIGEGLGIPMYMTAGAVVSGAFFGDKVSPLSDTTNFCANVTGSDLYAHIKGLMPSTIPAMVIAIVAYYFIGLGYTENTFNNTSVEELKTALNTSFVLGPYLLLPPIVVVGAALMRFPPIPSLFAGIVTAVILAVVVQGSSIEAILGTVMYGFRADTGVKFIDGLLSKGGLNSMMWIAGLMILTVCYGGLLERIRSIEVMVETIVLFVRGIGSAVLSNTIVVLVLIFTADLYIAYMISARVFCPITRGWKYSTTNVSRVMENSGTMMSPLVPWGAAGVFVSGNLGVPTIMYAPFAFACWIAPLFDILWGFTGYFLPKASKEEQNAWVEAKSKIAKDGKLIPISDWLDEKKEEK